MKNEDMNESKGQDSSPSNSDGEEELIACVGEDMVIDNKQLFLETEIDKTEFSTIYKALYKNKPVAVKIIKESGEASLVLPRKKKFLREVTMHYLAKHESVVRIIGASTKPRMQIVMELMKGGSLQKYFMDSQPHGVDQRLALSFAIQVSQAMEHLHGKGIVHRDLKLGNLLLTEDARKVKLADFGFARTVPKDKVMSPNAGTLFYMAPEMQKWKIGQQIPTTPNLYDHKVDVFSFSLLLWKLLVNRVHGPFEYNIDQRMDRAYEIYMNKERPSVENIPRGLVSLFESSWAEEATGRPEFNEITITLSQFLNTLN